ncbi:MAG: GGDEF domain-containing protein [Pseudomonadota bacterium]|nr:GGDEF domain-containing protein [Pseudomonadota bacterium]
MEDSLYKFKADLQSLFINLEDLTANPYDAFRVLLLAAILVVITLIVVGFAVFHLFITEQLQIAILNLIGVMVLLGLLYRLNQTKRAGLVGHIATSVILIFLPIFAAFNQNQEFGLVWLFFAPFVFVAFVGWRDALAYLTLFYFVLLSMAYNGIGQWDGGDWSELSFARLTVALLLGTALAVIADVANRDMNRQIGLQRAKELNYTQELRRLSTTDSLTEVYNRHYFQEVLDSRVKELEGTDLYLTFFILDIDHFKLYNDQFGHQEGDKVLYQVAQAVHSYIKRQDDLVFRLGGEEFGGLLVSERPKETSEWVAQLKNEIEALQIVHATEAPEKYITISIGVFSAKVKDVDTITCLYRIADKALYEAKQNGRNQAVIISPEQYPRGCE